MAGRFATTRWSVVLAAGGSGDNARDALETLCRTYWHPVYAFVRSSGHAADAALDLTQAFFLQRIEQGDVGNADPNRGRFRSWLIGALKHFLYNARDYDHAQKRDARKLVWLDAMTAEERYRLEARSDTDPERLYERGYALTLLGRCLERLEAECVANGNGILFARAKDWLHREPDAAWYAAVADALGISAGHARVKMHRLRRHWGQLVTEEVAELVEKPDDVRDEIDFLIRALQRSA